MTEPHSSHDFAYIHADIPAGMTIRHWRARRARRAAVPSRSRRWLLQARTRTVARRRRAMAPATTWIARRLRRGAETPSEGVPA